MGRARTIDTAIAGDCFVFDGEAFKHFCVTPENIMGLMQEAESLRQQLAESQARCKRHAELAFYAAQALGSCDTPERWAADKYLCESIALLSDSTALDSAIRQAKREALLEAADNDWCDSRHSFELRNMADELKG